MSATRGIPLVSPICPTWDSRMGQKCGILLDSRIPRTDKYMLDWSGICGIPVVSPICPTRYTMDSLVCTVDFDGELGHGSHTVSF